MLFKRRSRQGCMMSPDLFPLYSKNVMKSLEDMRKIKVVGHTINNLRYAGDTLLILGNKVVCRIQLT